MSGIVNTQIPFLFKSQFMKFRDLVKLKNAQIMLVWCWMLVRNNVLPISIKRLFRNREGRYDLRGQYYLTHPRVHTTLNTYAYQFVEWLCGMAQMKKLSKVQILLYSRKNIRSTDKLYVEPSDIRNYRPAYT